MKKRVFDVFFATALGIGLSPVIGCMAVAVAAIMGRPVIFKQTRLGKDGTVFDIYKFRSMTDARGADGALLPNHERTPAFGRMIRKFGLDELPQLYNIIKGDMSFVGPRPRSYPPCNKDAVIPENYKAILSVPPGLTGTAQVLRLQQRQDVDWKQKLRLDFEYAVNPESFRKDLKIIASTLPIFIKGNGATVRTGQDQVSSQPAILSNDR